MKKVLYVPLDDRPVNLDDVIVQGQSAGIHVITPHMKDIKNRLDSQKTYSDQTLLTTSSPTFGNTAKIRQFILKKAASVDGFIISADMLVYGGLIGSRRLRTSPGGDYPCYDSDTIKMLDVIRQIKQTYPCKPVFVLDTIMRMATTTYVEGTNINAYNEARTFAQQPRKSASDLTAILNSYDSKPDGTTFPSTANFDKDQYYNARCHKLKTNYYILDQLARLGYIDFLAVGVDDSYTQGIQANEIALIEGCINAWLGGIGGQNPDRAIILPEADGLGHSLMARMANQLYPGGEKTKYSVEYFGPDGSTIINPYEYMNLHNNIQRHIDIIGGQYVTGTSDVEILVITNADQATNAVSKVASNGENQKATIFIDCIGYVANATVTEALLGNEFTGRLLGYSSWNTFGNRVGLALGMGQARYAYLKTEPLKAAIAAANAHGSLLFKRFLKDYYYKVKAIVDIRGYSRTHSLYSNVTADQHMGLFNPADDFTILTQMLQDLMQSYADTLAGKSCFPIDSLTFPNPYFIWERAFEISLKPAITLQ